MKTHFIFLCLIIGGGFANAATQNKADPDKPSFIFVDKYSDDWEQDSGGDINSGATKNYMTTVDSDGKIWHSGNGTSFYHFDEPGSGEGWWDTTFFWSNVGSTNGYTTTGGFGDVSVDGSGPLSECQYIFTDPMSAPTEAWEVPGGGTLSHFYANINYAWNDGDDDTYRRNSKTFLKIKTGGKAGINQKNLFGFTANATAYGQPSIIWNDDASEFWGDTPTTSIDPTRIRVLGKNVGNDGNLFILLPDNATLDLAASAPGDHYSMNVSAQKYKLKIQVNGTTRISPLGVVRGANYCVGQKLTFSPYWLPSNPPFANDIAHWTLPENYVNEYVPPPSPEDGSGYYTNDASLLAGDTTSCWYVDALQAGTASIGMSLQFANGQIVPVAAIGQLNVYRPTISGFQITSTNFFAALVPTNSPNELQLGDNVPKGLMEYGLNVNSKAPFSGGANMVQLINASRSVANTGFGGGGSSSTSDGQFWLDNRNPLFSSDFPLNAGTGTPYSNYILFFDQPGYGLNYILGGYPVNLCSISDSFKDYIVFKPDGDGSIYVTLGRVFWSWSASTSKANGVWSSPTYQVNGPSAPDSSDEFPVWPSVYYNGIGSGD
jgi:hypothetical protein